MPTTQLIRASLTIPLALVAFPLLAACSTTQNELAVQENPLLLTEADHGTRHMAKVGLPFEVSLGGNGGTGYRWEFTPVPGISLVKSDINAHTPGLPGGAYTHNFILRAKTAGEYRLSFRHHRTWEKGTAAAKTVEFTVVAR